jgi:hypothetical protein
MDAARRLLAQRAGAGGEDVAQLEQEILLRQLQDANRAMLQARLQSLNFCACMQCCGWRRRGGS